MLNFPRKFDKITNKVKSNNIKVKKKFIQPLFLKHRYKKTKWGKHLKKFTNLHRQTNKKKLQNSIIFLQT